MTDGIVEKIGSAIEDLPPMPQVASRILKEIENPDAEVKTIYEILSKDAVLAGKILTLANSAYYSRGNPIASLPAAIRVLGFAAIRDVVVSVATASMFRKVSVQSREPVVRLWKHSLQTAYLCSLLSESTPESSSDELFVCGLLHDIGKVAILAKFPEQAEDIENYMQQSNLHGNGTQSINECEMKYLGFTHGQLGGVLLEKWQFPVSIRTIVERHHPAGGEEESGVDMDIVRLADLLSASMEGAYFEKEEYLKVLGNLSVDASTAEELCAKASERVDEDREVFGI